MRIQNYSSSTALNRYNANKNNNNINYNSAHKNVASFKGLVNEEKFVYDFVNNSNWPESRVHALIRYVSEIKSFLNSEELKDFRFEFTREKHHSPFFFQPRNLDEPVLNVKYMNTSVPTLYAHMANNIYSIDTVDHAIRDTKQQVSEIVELAKDLEANPELYDELKKDAEEKIKNMPIPPGTPTPEEVDEEQWSYVFNDPFPM